MFLLLYSYLIICICRKRKLTNSHHTKYSMKCWNSQCFSVVDMWRFSNLRSFLWIWYVFCRWRVSLNSRCNLMVLVDWCWCANLMKWFSCTACLWIKCWAAWNKEGKNSWVLYLTIHFHEFILFGVWHTIRYFNTVTSAHEKTH